MGMKRRHFISILSVVSRGLGRLVPGPHDFAVARRSQRFRRLLFFGVASLACLLAFVQAADRNYRSEGFLGRTEPPYQRAIIDGTAPAPYIYRQAVPRLRAGLEVFLLPGHAALLTDVILATMAAIASIGLATWGFGAPMRFVGILVATVACSAVYPNDKPEAVSAIAMTTAIAAFVLAGRFNAALLIAGVGILVRADISILFSLAIAVGLVATGHAQAGASPRIAWRFFGVALLGLLYLLLARFAIWPNSAYPPGVPFFMGLRNLVSPLAWPGLALGIGLAILGSMQAFEAVRLRKQRTSQNERSVAAVLAIGLFTLLYATAIVVAGKTEEIRLFQPLLPLTLLTGLRSILPGVSQELIGAIDK